MLRDEMLSMEFEPRPGGARYRVSHPAGRHDDAVFSVGLAAYFLGRNLEAPKRPMFAGMVYDERTRSARPKAEPKPAGDTEYITEEVRVDEATGRQMVWRIFPGPVRREVPDRIYDGTVKPPMPWRPPKWCEQGRHQVPGDAFTCLSGGPDHTFCRDCAKGHRWCVKCQ